MHPFPSCADDAPARAGAETPETIAALIAEAEAAEAEAPAPSPSPASAPVPPVALSRRTTRVDWALVTRLVAEGRTAAEVAREVGCCRQHVWRVVGRSRARADRTIVAGMNARLSELRLELVEGLARGVEAGDPRLMLWLAERLSVGVDGAASAGRRSEDTARDYRFSRR